MAILLPSCSSEVEDTSNEAVTYTVSTAAELLEWAASSRTDNNCILAADIDMDGLDWTPKTFNGTFDGQGHTISNLTVTTYISDAGFGYTGFIGYLYTGTIKDLRITGASVTGTTETSYAYTGGIAGIVVTDGVISGCSFSGTVTGKDYTGGIAGYVGNKGVISGCSFSGTATSKSTSSSNYGYAGGIVGYAQGGITDCYVSGTVTSEKSGDYAYAGGIAGRVSGSEITACYSDANVTATSYAGGIAGYAAGTSNVTYYIAACYSSGEVKSTGSYAGGIAGHDSYSTLIGCYSTATVSGSTAAGGLVGYMSGGDTTACYWSGNAASGVGYIYSSSSSSSSYTDNTTKVESDWSDAMSAMNTALSDDGYSYTYRANSGSDSESFPLALE